MDRFVRLKDGALMPKLGQGTWFWEKINQRTR